MNTTGLDVKEEIDLMKSMEEVHEVEKKEGVVGFKDWVKGVEELYGGFRRGGQVSGN